MTNGEAQALALLHDLIQSARRQAADAADAVYSASSGLSVTLRLGRPEDVERSESIDLGLRVLIGHRQAIVSSSDTKPAALKLLVERAIAMAKAAPEDPYCGLGDSALLAQSPPDLDLLDSAEPTEAQLIARAASAEDAARAIPGVVNSEGAGASFHKGLTALATSAGFAHAYSGSHHGHSVEVVAGANGALERDYDYSSARYLTDLTDAAEVGRSAGTRAVKRLNARKIKSGAWPVVFDARCSASLLSHLAGAINGASIARGTSFLKDRLQEMVFAPEIEIIDDPLRPRGLRSRPFDGEGAAGQRRVMVEGGRLTSWFLDSATARQLKLSSTGHASRGTSSPPSPSPSNLYLAAGAVSAAELIGDIREGLLVTELMGMAVNGITGDYSRGAAGFWIERGEIAFPVSEITVAGNLKDMFRHLRAANDLAFKFGIDCPTVRIEGMVVAGA